MIVGTGGGGSAFAARRPVRPGREKLGSDGTLVKGLSDTELEGDDVEFSSTSASLLLAAATRLENGTLSPFRRLPLRYVVRLDLCKRTPGAAGRIGMSSLSGSPIPASWRRLVSSVSFCIALEGSLTSSSSSLRSEILSSGALLFESDLFLSNCSAPSLYPIAPLPYELSICFDNIDFFRRKPPLDPLRSGPSGDNDENSPERRLIV